MKTKDLVSYRTAQNTSRTMSKYDMLKDTLTKIEIIETITLSNTKLFKQTIHTWHKKLSLLLDLDTNKKGCNDWKMVQFIYVLLNSLLFIHF